MKIFYLAFNWFLMMLLKALYKPSSGGFWFYCLHTYIYHLTLYGILHNFLHTWHI